MKNRAIALLLILGCIFAIACGDKKKDDKKEDTTTTETATPEASAPEVKGFIVEISGDDAMKYDKTEIKVPVGENIILTLKHTGTMAKAVMGHNFVILNKGTDAPAFAEKASLANTTDYIPESEKASILAHTKTIGGGEEDTIEFTIDEAGTYDFLCTFPAHYALMKGVVIAE